MVRFVFVFLVCLILLFTAELLQPVQEHVIVPFTTGLAHLSVWLMRVFDHSVVARDNDIPSMPSPAAASRSSRAAMAFLEAWF